MEKKICLKLVYRIFMTNCFLNSSSKDQNLVAKWVEISTRSIKVFIYKQTGFGSLSWQQKERFPHIIPTNLELLDHQRQQLTSDSTYREREEQCTVQMDGTQQFSIHRHLDVEWAAERGWGTASTAAKKNQQQQLSTNTSQNYQ